MTMDPEMLEILKVFFDETDEGLDVMEKGLLRLDANADREVINSIFRAAHSIKGGSGTFGFGGIAQFTHRVEAVLDEMRNGKRTVTADAVQLLLQSVDVIREMIDHAKAERAPESPGALALSERLAGLLSTGAATPPVAVPAASTVAPTDAPPPAAAREVAGRGRWRIDFRPHATLFKTCNDPLRLFTELATLGELDVRARADRLPDLAALDPTDCYLDWTLDVTGDVTEARLREVFDWVDANSSVTIERLDAPASPAAAAAVPTAAAPVVEPAPAPARPTGPVAPAAPRQAPEAASMRVATGKVDHLINLVGELVITQSMLDHFSTSSDSSQFEALRRGLALLARNTRQLQESVLNLRMLPISFSFNRFPRLVHELSRKLGKNVDLRLSGENTELDKTVLERIADPLVHLVRNALDHGLESPAARAAAGKDPTGVVELKAYHESGGIVIEVNDDGAGINRDRVLQKARQRQLVDNDAQLSDEQVCNLIFMPGFSTAEEVSDVSGRGVGMDVVRRNIAELGGSVQVMSEPGRGSSVRIRLPLTLAILEAQMLRVGRESYVMSLVSIIETVQPRKDCLFTVAGRTEVYRYRDEYLPIIRLHQLFGTEPDSREITRGLLVVTESGGRRVAILVDELRAQQQVVIKSLDTNFRPVRGLAGATIHGDGAVALILDVTGLIGLFHETCGRAFDDTADRARSAA